MRKFAALSLGFVTAAVLPVDGDDGIYDTTVTITEVGARDYSISAQVAPERQ